MNAAAQSAPGAEKKRTIRYEVRLLHLTDDGKAVVLETRPVCFWEDVRDLSLRWLKSGGGPGGVPVNQLAVNVREVRK